MVAKKSVIDGKDSLTHTLRSAPVGVTLDQLHKAHVESGDFTEEEFFLAFHAAGLSLSDF